MAKWETGPFDFDKAFELLNKSNEQDEGELSRSPPHRHLWGRVPMSAKRL
jgi:hypothetical protein